MPYGNALANTWRFILCGHTLMYGGHSLGNERFQLHYSHKCNPLGLFWLLSALHKRQHVKRPDCFIILQLLTPLDTKNEKNPVGDKDWKRTPLNNATPQNLWGFNGFLVTKQ